MTQNPILWESINIVLLRGEKSPEEGRGDAVAFGDGLGGCGDGFGRIIAAAGVVRGVGNGGRRAVEGRTACGGGRDATIRRIPAGD